MTLLTTLALAVRRANAEGDPTTLGGWRARVRKVFTSWLPFAVMTATALWLVLSWTFFLVLQGTGPTGPLALLAGVGLTLALVLNANLTAVHSYYRARLSNAFAVARSDTGGAAALPYHRPYDFSDLGEIPLHVVTTANVHAYDEVPSRRGGLPVVFGPTASGSCPRPARPASRGGSTTGPILTRCRSWRRSPPAARR